MWSLYSCENRIFVPKDSVNQPSQRVSPEAKKGRASASRRTSSAGQIGTSPKTAPVRRAIGLDGAGAHRAGGVGDHDNRPGMIEATAPDVDQSDEMGPEVEVGSLSDLSGFDQCRAFAQSRAKS